MTDLAKIAAKMSDPVFAIVVLEFLVALGFWIHSLVKRTNRRRFWFVITLITFFIFWNAVGSPHLGN